MVDNILINTIVPVFLLTGIISGKINIKIRALAMAGTNCRRKKYHYQKFSRHWVLQIKSALIHRH